VSSDDSKSDASSKEDDEAVEVLSLFYYEPDGKLSRLEDDLRLKRTKERGIRNGEVSYRAWKLPACHRARQALQKLREEINSISTEIKQRKARAQKGCFELIKGKTTFYIPNTTKKKFYTEWAFEIHVHERKTRRLTLACDRFSVRAALTPHPGSSLSVSSKDRKHFIETVKRALLTKAEVQRLREKFLNKQTVPACRDCPHARARQCDSRDRSASCTAAWSRTS
jgi:hypothetical protein